MECIIDSCQFWNVIFGFLFSAGIAFYMWNKDKKQNQETLKTIERGARERDVLRRRKKFYYKPIKQNYEKAREFVKEVNITLPSISWGEEGRPDDWFKRIRTSQLLTKMQHLLRQYSSLFHFLETKGNALADLRAYNISVEELTTRTNALQEYIMLSSFGFKQLEYERDALFHHLKYRDEEFYYGLDSAESAIGQAESTLKNIEETSGFENETLSEWMQKNRRMMYKQQEYRED